ncbi:MAG TPA: hypothetical protein VNM90_05600 [Haliangium sp.]|nr:hypothetical protein [Haliangium sp.]
MTSGLGSLGKPRVAIALLWFLDGARRPGEPAAPAHPPDPSGPPRPPPSVTPEDIELVRSLTGLAPVELVARLQDIAAGYERDPATLRAELLRITDGDEIAVEHLMQLIHAAVPGDDEADADRAGGERGRVITLPLRVPGSGDDDEGDP